MVSKGLVIGIVVLVLVVGGYFIFNQGDGSAVGGSDVNVQTGGGEVEKSLEESLWYTTELTDVGSGESFRISDFKDKPVLLESFAVWCPTCTAQQKVIRDFHEEVGDSVVSISLNTDANENASLVNDHIESNGFDWRYAIVPIEVVQSLVDDFGASFLSAPSAPIALICNGEAQKLKSGLKSVSDLKEAIEGC